MITDEKIAAIRKLLRRGEPEGEIREALAREGYSKADIDRVFAPRPYDMRSWYLVSGVLIALFGVWVYAVGGGFLPFVFSALLFVQYFREGERLKKKNGSH